MLKQLRPSMSKRNTDTGLLKLIAIVSMLIDHLGAAVFTDQPWMRQAGRLALPIFAYCIAMGCVYTHNHSKYASRIALTALISQPIYAISMNHLTAAARKIDFSVKPISGIVKFYAESWKAKPGILVSLFLCVLIIWALREKKYILSIGSFLLAYLISGKLDYGMKAIYLVLLFYFTIEYPWYVSLPVMAAYMLYMGGFLHGSHALTIGALTIRYDTQIFALAALPFIFVPTKSGIKLPKTLFYLFYPAHLILVYALKLLLK